MQRAHELLSIRIDHELIGIETVSRIWLVRAMDPIGVHCAWTCGRDITVPDFIGVFGQLDPFDLFLAPGIEEAELDLGGISGKQREIDAKAIPGRPKRKGLTFQHRRMPQSCRRQGQSFILEPVHEHTPSARGQPCASE
jgi:hypothetical protein